jgi:RNA-splicing ligase RtcB
MLIASKSGCISAAKLVSETDKAWTLEVESNLCRVSKSDSRRRAFNAMSDALKWAGADQEMIDHFVDLEAKSNKLPDGAYAALEGLKAQAGAAMLMLPGTPREEAAKGKKALKAAHAQIAANEPWAKKIMNALMKASRAGDRQITVVTADAAWLERTFAEKFR